MCHCLRADVKLSFHIEMFHSIGGIKLNVTGFVDHLHITRAVARKLHIHDIHRSVRHNSYFENS